MLNSAINIDSIQSIEIDEGLSEKNLEADLKKKRMWTKKKGNTEFQT